LTQKLSRNGYIVCWCIKVNRVKKTFIGLCTSFHWYMYYIKIRIYTAT